MPDRLGRTWTHWIGAVSGVAFTVACVLAIGLIEHPSFARVGERAPAGPPDDGADARRWPTEIEQVLASLAADDPAASPVQANQRCATVDDGELAHCVRVECQQLDDQTACVEMIVTARRLPAAPASTGAQMESLSAPSDAARPLRPSQRSEPSPGV